MNVDHDLDFRPARLEDRPALWAICDRTWGGQDPLKKRLDDFISNPDALLLCAEHRGRVVGCIIGQWLTPREAWLGYLRKDPEASVRGLARAATHAIIERMRAIEPACTFRGSTSIDQRVQLHVLPRLGFEEIARRTLWLRPPTDGSPPRRPVITGDPASWQIRSACVDAIPRLLNLEWTVYERTHDTLRRQFVDRGGWLRIGPPDAPEAEALVWRDERYHTVSWLGGDPQARLCLLDHVEADARRCDVPVAFFLDGSGGGLASALPERGYAIWKAPDAFRLYALRRTGD
ncbi:MAG: GNAT family N-acetyltransferase [bacterium]